MKNEQTPGIPLDLAIARRFAAEVLAPERQRKAVAGIKTIEIALASLRRRIEAGEDVTDQIRAIALLVGKLETTLGGGR
jgi:hypothetical protein